MTILKARAAKSSSITRLPLFQFTGLRVLPGNRRDIEGRRQIGNDGIKKRLNTFISERRSAEHRNTFQRNGGFPERPYDDRFINGAAFQIV